MKNKKN